METAPLKSFATWARRELITQVSARLTAVLAPASPERVENQRAVTKLERDIAAAGGGAKGKDAVADKVAYTWFNRIIALRFMDANGYTGVGVVSPPHGQQTGQPEILADAKRGSIDPAVVGNTRTLDAITGLLDGTRPSADAQSEAYTLLLAEYCRYWNRSMPFMFEREGDYTELLIPANLLAPDSILSKAASTLTAEVCRDVEVIGWLYQFYISERKDEVFAGFRKGKKAGAEEIPAATQLFTPHWIVRFLVENSIGRLWMLNHPSSGLVEQMDYYIAPEEEETDFLKISSPEELTVIDPACGSGHMLTYAFDLLYAIYEEEGYAPSEIPSLILTHNLYGIEIDARAGSLAAFALTMKARARQRTLFSKTVKLNICVLEPVSFNPDELDSLLSGGGGNHAEELFWNQFAEAETLGSLIRPDPVLTQGLADQFAPRSDGGDLLSTALLDNAKQVVQQARFLSSQYAVVVANPPYMGRRNQNQLLADFALRNYPSSKADLFSMFIERCIHLALPHGSIGMITMQGWMFLPGFAGLRERIVRHHRIQSMAHLGTRGFDSISGEVVATTAFVLERDGDSYASGDYFRLTEVAGEAEKSDLFRQQLSAHAAGSAHRRVSQESFGVVPGAPIAYWASEMELELFTKNRSVADIGVVRAGMATGDNDFFVRQWFEVERRRLKLDATSASEVWSDPVLKWVIFNKGGDARRWYGNLDHVLAYDRASYAMLKESGNRCPSEELYFRECLTWSDVSTQRFAPRFMAAGSVLSTVGNSIYGERDQLPALCCALASTVVSGMMPLLNPTLHANPGDVARLPVPSSGDHTVFDGAVRLAKDDWHAVETAWGFERPDWLMVGSHRLADLFRSSDGDWQMDVRRMAELEAENDWRQRRAYNLEDRENPGHISPTHLDEVTLRRNFFNGGRWDTASADHTRASELLSYAIGCMFGRYSLDEPGLVLADQGATVQDYLAVVPAPSFIPDPDNVLPIVDGDWFEDDIVARLRQFLRVAFGEQYFEENLRFVEESLGVKSLREYFITRAGRSKFYDDHVKRYKKRPIYWLLSSPKGSFNALIYMHRYTPSTVSTVLNEYLREFESKLEANLQHQERLAAGEGTPREKAAALKEAERLRKVLVELSEYEHDVLYPLASQQVAIDLDDGVKANYPKFYPALKKIAGLEATDD